MQDPGNLVQIINRKRFSTATSIALASNSTTGRTTYLYRSSKGTLFFACVTIWQDEKDSIQPTNQIDALHFFETSQVQHVAYDVAFPDVEIEDA